MHGLSGSLPVRLWPTCNCAESRRTQDPARYERLQRPSSLLRRSAVTVSNHKVDAEILGIPVLIRNRDLPLGTTILGWDHLGLANPVHGQSFHLMSAQVFFLRKLALGEIVARLRPEADRGWNG